MIEPSSQGPCICPEYGIAFACPRHAFAQDYIGDDPFKQHLAEEAWHNGARPS